MQSTQWRRLMRAAYFGLVAVVFIAALVPIPDAGPPGSDKLEHFATFFVLTVGAGLLFAQQPLWRAGVLLIIYGGLIELAQGLPFIGRDCDLADWLTDGAAVIAVSASLALSRLHRRGGADKPAA